MRIHRQKTEVQRVDFHLYDPSDRVTGGEFGGLYDILKWHVRSLLMDDGVYCILVSVGCFCWFNSFTQQYGRI